MATSGVVSDLYTDPDQRGSMPAAPSAPPPTPAAPPSQQSPAAPAVPIKTPRMADEGPDGRIRDTSGDALRPGNDLSFREFDPDPKETPESQEPEKPAEAVAPPVPEPPKMYAGKFKTPEDLEKSYRELEAHSTRLAQEKAELERQRTAQAAAPPEPPKPQLTDAQRREQLLQRLVNEPDKVLGEIEQSASRSAQMAMQQTQSALAAQSIATEWRKNNPDIAEHEKFVTQIATELTASDPELAKDPVALVNRASDTWRQITGKIRTDAKKEALTTESRVIRLQDTAPATATEQPSQKAPLSDDAAFDTHIRMLKAEERRSHQGLRR